MKRLIAIILVMLVLLSGISLSVSAEPTDSFTHIDRENGTQVSVMSREMYKSTKVISASSLGLEQSLKGLNDLCIDGSDNVYLLASDRSQIVVLNSDYTYQKTIEIKDEEGNQLKFKGAQGIYVDKNNTVYICDTSHSQILVSDINGNLIDVLEQPESSLIPEDFYYQPYRIVKDEKGYTYILSQGCYYGALAYSPKNKFLGFYGANTVKATALDTLSFLWDKLTQTDEKKELSAKSLPYSFVDLALDSEGYIVTCTGITSSEENGTGQIRKLSPGGGDILYKRTVDGSSITSTSYNFLESKLVKKQGSNRIQNIVAVATDENDFIYAIDQEFSLVYVYDSECNMLGGFGGGNSGSLQKGIFSKPVSIKVHRGSILVADSDTERVTVFETTDYGKALMEAQSKYIKGDYEESEELWGKVLSLDNGNQLAYRGLAMSALTATDYENALKYSKLGLDYTVYDMAWQKIISQKMSDNFLPIFIIAMLVIVGFVSYIIVKKKRNFVLVKNAKLKVALNSVVHPFDIFGEMRYRNSGSTLIAFVIMILFYLSKVLESTASGFLFKTTSPATYNMLYTLLGTVGLVLLWSLANYLVACLASGIGTFKEVFIGTNYSLIPLVVYTFVRVVLSHFLPLSGLALMNGISVAIIIFTFFLLSVAMMAIHEYDSNF